MNPSRPFPSSREDIRAVVRARIAIEYAGMMPPGAPVDPRIREIIDTIPDHILDRAWEGMAEARER